MAGEAAKDGHATPDHHATFDCECRFFAWVQGDNYGPVSRRCVYFLKDGTLPLSDTGFTQWAAPDPLNLPDALASGCVSNASGIQMTRGFSMTFTKGPCRAKSMEILFAAKGR
ncbi:hypothetical protein EOS_35825 [Caballeronia mineralivorans PML1(12)]|uniref:Uncharacterized protein n=1 Tax=Caballeronia mineralivorans PML1(12) TaxID=908627 RepID=A0A0J1FNZ7_9BURK|nr:hypothetical protein EOS_35825 [Caballeronia mineralivorans PML1(12)]